VKQIFTIAAAQAENSNRAEQVLSIRAGLRHFGFAISNREGTELEKISWHTAEEMTEETLTAITHHQPELQERFAQVLIAYDYPESVLVPLQHYKEDDSRILLEGMYGVQAGVSIITETIPGWQIKNVYAVPKAIHNFLVSQFANASWCHNYTAGIGQADMTVSNDFIVADFRPDEFSLLAFRNQQLLQAQTYSYATPADVLYRLLKTCETHGLSQEETPLFLSGLVEKQSTLYHELYQYFLRVRFREPLWDLTTDQTEEYPAHFFTSLNDLSRCAS